MPEDGAPIPPPPAPPLPSNTGTPPAGAGSSKSKTPLKAVSSSASKTSHPHGKPPASPGHVQNASPVGPKREAARDRIRAGLKASQLLSAVSHEYYS